MNVFAGHGLLCVRGERAVFAGLDFEVGEGGALVLIGPNGVGKSSLLRLMAGLLKPAAGELRWNGAALFDDPEAHRARLRYLGHLDGVQPLLKVAENLKFWAGLRGAGGAAGQAAGRGLDEAAHRALEAFGLAHLADIPCRFLSAGQLRRLALARIIATNAALWLLDEPTAGLDSDAVAALERAVGEHRGRGGMVVLASHAAATPDDAATLELSAYATAPSGPAADEEI